MWQIIVAAYQYAAGTAVQVVVTDIWRDNLSECTDWISHDAPYNFTSRVAAIVAQTTMLCGNDHRYYHFRTYKLPGDSRTCLQEFIGITEGAGWEVVVAPTSSRYMDREVRGFSEFSIMEHHAHFPAEHIVKTYCHYLKEHFIPEHVLRAAAEVFPVE